MSNTAGFLVQTSSFALMVVLFTYFYTAITVKPDQHGRRNEEEWRIYSRREAGKKRPLSTLTQ
jgi:preprotein translocase subunit SecY